MKHFGMEPLVPKINIKAISFAYDNMPQSSGVILDSKKVEKEEVDRGENILIQKLITDDQGAENCFMRKFTIKPGGSMPHHEHDKTDHVQYILKGKMKVKLGKNSNTAEEGNVLHIPSDVPHSYQNPYDEEVVFLCIVPAGDIKTQIKE